LSTQVRLPIAACSPSTPHYALATNNGDEITFTDQHLEPATGSLPEQYLVCHPTFVVRSDALWELPESYTLARHRLSDESLARLRGIWEARDRDHSAMELTENCKRVIEMQEEASNGQNYGASITAMLRTCNVL